MDETEVKSQMSEKEVALRLAGLLNEFFYDGELLEEFSVQEFEDAEVLTYDDVGMLTMNSGIVIRLENGQEIRMTVHA